MSCEVLLVGCGNMGRALLAGWLDQGMAASSICVIEPADDQAAAAAASGVRLIAAASELAAPPDVVVLAVKPQVIDAVVGALAGVVAAGALVLSIAAGKPIARLQAGLGRRPDDVAVVRAMPNTPAAVRRGITVASASATVTEAQRRRCDRLLSAVGAVLWVDDEALLDPVTAVSGSGPAYVFLLAEYLARAGAAAGLPPALAERLARETIVGAGELLARSADTPEQLRRNVTSPGGTTAAALSILMDDDRGLAPLLERAVDAASRRARELAG